MSLRTIIDIFLRTWHTRIERGIRVTHAAENMLIVTLSLKNYFLEKNKKISWIKCNVAQYRITNPIEQDARFINT